MLARKKQYLVVFLSVGFEMELAMNFGFSTDYLLNIKQVIFFTSSLKMDIIIDISQTNTKHLIHAQYLA